MDLGCFDMGCIEKKPTNDAFSCSQNSPTASTTSTSKQLGKNKGMKEGGQSSLVSLNKSASQIRKPPHRKTSPLNWFPRKKVDSYLKRKIKMFQEVDGMNSTLDETLGDSNPHYCRVLREKIAVKEAAQKAVEARKAALVEASWCRILQAARIDCKEAEQQLIKAEKYSAEAFEAATAIGVILHDIPDCSQKHYKIEMSPAKGGPTTHTVRTSFETAFEVDKQVATAVKAALLKLASNCPSMNKDEVKDLLRKISENPDETDGNHHELSEFSSECESDTASEVTYSETKSVGVKQRKYKKREAYDEKFNMSNLVEMMLERLRCLQEDELASLATIVATCGLNAALAEAGNKDSVLAFEDRAVKGSNMDDGTSRSAEELPSLDKFLVKRLTRLEREVLEAKNARSEAGERSKQRQDKSSVHSEGHANSGDDLASILKKPSSKFEKEIEEAKNNSQISFRNKEKASNSSKLDSSEVPDFGSMLANNKHASKLEKEIEEAKRKNEKLNETESTDSDRIVGGPVAVGRKKKHDIVEVPLEDYLVKHVTRLEKEVQEAKIRRNTAVPIADSFETTSLVGKENVNQNVSNDSEQPSKVDYESKEAMDSLEKILVKPVHHLQRLKMQEPSTGSSDYVRPQRKTEANNGATDCEGLDKILVKHVSKLEKEKMSFHAKEENLMTVKKDTNGKQLQNGEGSLDQILVKHKSRLEREKMAAVQWQDDDDDQIRHSLSRKEARKQELQESWGGLSLGNSLHPHTHTSRYKSRLEREKMAGVERQDDDDQTRSSLSRKEARERELQESWGGLSLGNSLRPHTSRLQRDKAAWIKAEEEERKRTVTEV